jgi:hypothetical protein
MTRNKMLIRGGLVAALGLLSGGLYAQGPSDLHCLKSFGKTGGWVECTGRGTWRAKADCANEPDDYSKWVTQGKGPHREYVECTFRIRGVSYEVRSSG